MKQQTGFYLTERAREWLKIESAKRGISMSDVVQEWINGEIDKLRRDRGNVNEMSVL